MPRRKKSLPKKRKQQNPSPRSKPSSPGPAFEKLVNVMARLRSPTGCPWDREQSHSTLRTYLIEEAYEVLDAMDSSDDTKFAEELGDLLLQVLFHAQIAAEENRFSIHDVIREIHDKMVRRHPHVFANTKAKTSADVLRNWEQIKKQERAAKNDETPSSSPESFLDGVPKSQPALLEANQLTKKAARVGFDWPNIEGIFDKLSEESTELRQALTNNEPPARIESELGDLIFVVVNLARYLKIDPEIATKKASAKFSRRFREMERLAAQQGTTLSKLSQPQQESLWAQSKQSETKIVE
jgi:nucleoside triphosphate diphosphatase